jgi:ATP-dependent protease ClpP protease subunit
LDTIRSLKPPVHTHGTIGAHAITAILLASGAPGFRSASKDCVVSFTELRPGQALTPDNARFFEKLSLRIVEVTQGCTGLFADEVRELMASGRYLTALEAAGMGIVDEVIQTRLKDFVTVQAMPLKK